jgi:hypothetical protein
MRRTLFLFAILFLFCSNGFAQIFRFGVPNLEDYDMERFHYGFSLGIDMVDVNLKTQTSYVDLIDNSKNELLEIYSKPVPAFNVGIVGNMRLGRYFDLRFIPGFSIAHDIDLYYRFKDEVFDAKNKSTQLLLVKIGCHYINLPVMIKFKSSRMHNVRLYALAGGQLGLNMLSRKNSIMRIADLKDAVKTDITPIIKPYDVQVKGGFGFDFYTTYFKFSTEFKVSFGVINLLESETRLGETDPARIAYYKSSPIVSGLQSLKSKTFTISFIIE